MQLKTQHNNIRSRTAIEKIGGIYEGIIREHMLKDDGTFRSSAYFSILISEWEKVKELLFPDVALDEEPKVTTIEVRSEVEAALKLLDNFELEKEFHKIFHQYVLTVFEKDGYELADV